MLSAKKKIQSLIYYFSKTTHYEIKTHSKRTNNEEKTILHNVKLSSSKSKRHKVLQTLFSKTKNYNLYSSTSKAKVSSLAP